MIHDSIWDLFGICNLELEFVWVLGFGICNLNKLALRFTL